MGPLRRKTLSTLWRHPHRFFHQPQESTAMSTRDKPVRNGDTYCSPRCGCKCTHADYLKATRTSRAVAARLGAPWKPYVWENCGWHWSVRAHNVELHRFADKTWWADGDFYGKQVTAEGSTAKRALITLRCHLKQIIAQANTTLKYLP